MGAAAGRWQPAVQCGCSTVTAGAFAANCYSQAIACPDCLLKIRALLLHQVTCSSRPPGPRLCMHHAACMHAGCTHTLRASSIHGSMQQHGVQWSMPDRKSKKPTEQQLQTEHLNAFLGSSQQATAGALGGCCPVAQRALNIHTLCAGLLAAARRRALARTWCSVLSSGWSNHGAALAPTLAAEGALRSAHTADALQGGATAAAPGAAWRCSACCQRVMCGRCSCCWW